MRYLFLVLALIGGISAFTVPATHAVAQCTDNQDTDAQGDEDCP
jgi:hypothetical protein